MSNLDVSLTLKLIKDQFGAAAQDAAKDLGQIKDAAEKLGATPGPKKLDETLKAAGAQAKDTAKDLSAVQEAAQKLGANDNPLKLSSGMKAVQTNAREAASAVSAVGDKASKVDKAMHNVSASAATARRSILAIAGTAVGVGLLTAALAKAGEKLRELANASADFEATSARRAEQMGMRGQGESVRAAVRDASAKAGVSKEEVGAILDAYVGRGGKWGDIAPHLADLGVYKDLTGASGADIGRALNALTRRKRSNPAQAMPALRSVLAQNLDGPFAQDMPRVLAETLDAGGFGGEDDESVRHYGALARVIAENSGSADRAKDVVSGVRKKLSEREFRQQLKAMGVDVDKVAKQARKKGQSELEAVLDASYRAMERKKWRLRGKAGEVNPYTGEIQGADSDLEGPIVDPEFRQAVEDQHRSRQRIRDLSRLPDERANAEIEKSRIEREKQLQKAKQGRDASGQALGDKLGQAGAPAAKSIEDIGKKASDAGNAVLDALPDSWKEALGGAAVVATKVPPWLSAGVTGAAGTAATAWWLKRALQPAATGAAAAGGNALAMGALGGVVAPAAIAAAAVAAVAAATPKKEREALTSTAGYPSVVAPKPGAGAPIGGKAPIGVDISQFPEAWPQAEQKAKSAADKVGKATKVDLKPMGAQAMQTYAAGIESQGAGAVAAASGVVEKLKAMLNTTFTPTIAPRVTAPSSAPAAPAPGKQTRVRGSAVNIQHAHFHGVHDAGAMHRQLAGLSRQARGRRDDALHDVDTGGYA